MPKRKKETDPERPAKSTDGSTRNPNDTKDIARSKPPTAKPSQPDANRKLEK